MLLLSIENCAIQRKLIKMSFRIIRSDVSLKGLTNAERRNRSAKVSYSCINVGHHTHHRHVTVEGLREKKSYKKFVKFRIFDVKKKLRIKHGR